MNMVRNFPKVLGLLFVLVCLGVSGCSSGKVLASLKDKKAPYTSFVKLDGGDSVLLDQYRGNTVVLLFWAETCAASRSLIKELDTFAKNYRGTAKIVVLAASIDKNEQYNAVIQRIQADKLDHMQHFFSGNEHYDQAYLSFGLDSIPAMLLIDPKGTIQVATRSLSDIEDYLKSHT